MGKFYIEKTKSTPEIYFDPEQSTFFIKGESYPENSFEFYKPIFVKLQQVLNEMPTLKLVLEVSYLNTSSTKSIVNILVLLNRAWESGKKIEVEWFYEVDNEHALELAEDFQEFIDLPFTLIPLE